MINPTVHSLPRIAIDVGNIRTKLGLFPSRSLSKSSEELPTYLTTTAFASESASDWTQISRELKIDPRTPHQIIIAGSNPVAMESVIQASREFWHEEPHVIVDRSRFPFSIQVDQPQNVGMDRLLNAMAIFRLKPSGQASIIIDTGTATTVDLVGVDQAFLGGAILPGFELCARALHRYTAQLPLLDVHDLFDHIPEVIGKNTHDAVCSGLYWGHVGAVNQLITQMSAIQPENCAIYLTGGAAPLLSPHLPDHTIYVHHLGLRGLVALDNQR